MRILAICIGIISITCTTASVNRRLKQKKARIDFEIPVMPVMDGGVVGAYSNPLPTYDSPGYYLQAITKRTPISYICPPGFNKISEDYCDQINTRLATRTCSNGLRMRNGLCVGVDQHRPDYYCPSGQTLKDNICLRDLRFESEIICPTGFRLTGSYCTRITYSDVVPFCEVGWIYQGKSCARTIEDDVLFVCPDGYERSSKFNGSSSKYSPFSSGPDFTCDRNIDVPLIEKCPIKGKWGCPDGFRSDIDSDGSKMSCVREFRRPAMEECFAVPSDKKDAQTRNICEPVCPPDAVGLDIKEGICIFEERQPAVDLCVWECPLTAPASKGNPYGQNKKNGCYEIESIDPMMVCPSKEHRMSPVLGKQSVSNAKLGAATGHVLSKGGKDLYSTSTGESVIGHVCLLDEHKLPQQGCDLSNYPDAVLTDESAKLGKCVSDVQIMAQRTCPPGSVLIGNNCVMSDSIPAMVFCQEGYFVKMDGQICHRDIIEAPDWQCPNGFELQKIDMLVQEVMTTPVFNDKKKNPQCDEKDKKCTITKEGPAVLHETGTCVQILTAPSQPVCPKGYTMVENISDGSITCEQTDIMSQIQQPTEVLSETPDPPQPVEPVVLVQYVQPPPPEPIIQYEQIVVQMTTPKPCKHKKCHEVTTPAPVVAAYPIAPQGKAKEAKSVDVDYGKKY